MQFPLVDFNIEFDSNSFRLKGEARRSLEKSQRTNPPLIREGNRFATIDSSVTAY